MSESTIKGDLAHLLAALNWARKVGMLHAVPEVTMPRRAKRDTKASPRQGRPITAEEFERMLEAVTSALFPGSKKNGKAAKPLSTEERECVERHRVAVVAKWRHYLRGLWLSGLRLEESDGTLVGSRREAFG